MMASRRYLYFIREGDSGPFKIGFTSRGPAKRLREVQIGNPRRLTLFGWRLASPDAESDLHRDLAEHRLEGEWFAPTPEVLKEARNTRRVGKLQRLVGPNWSDVWLSRFFARIERADQ